MPDPNIEAANRRRTHELVSALPYFTEVVFKSLTYRLSGCACQFLFLAMSPSGSQTISFSFNVSLTEDASCRATSTRWLKFEITHPYPNLPIHGRRGPPSFPPVLSLSVAAKKGTKMAAKWSPAKGTVRSEPFPLLRSVVRNGPEPSRARRYWARRSEPLTARTVLR
jgi:hypothetical protein